MLFLLRDRQLLQNGDTLNLSLYALLLFFLFIRCQEVKTDTVPLLQSGAWLLYYIYLKH